MVAVQTCSGIVQLFINALSRRADLPPVQIIGGIGASALLHEDTKINLDERLIEAPGSCDLPLLRPDGTVRDIDTLVLSTTETKVEAVRLVGEQAVDGQLKVSAFGLKTVADLERQRRRPWRITSRVFLADRYVADTDKPAVDETFQGFKALYPFRTPMNPDMLETFQLSINGRPAVPTAHPGAALLNYLTRSISGLRAKDAAKVEAMADNLLNRYPDLEAWILDGPGRHTVDLARILHTLSQIGRPARTLRLGGHLQIEPYQPAELFDHPGFMAADRSPGMQRALIGAAHLKSIVLARFEARSGLVSFWQRHIEDRIDPIIHNDTDYNN